MVESLTCHCGELHVFLLFTGTCSVTVFAHVNMHIGYMYIDTQQDSCSYSKETMCVLHVSVQQLRSDGKGTLCILCILGILLCTCMALYTHR